MTEEERKKGSKGDERERKEGWMEVTLNCSALILEEIVLKMV